MEFDNDSHSPVVFMPSVYTKYHWTAHATRVVVALYKKNGQFVWSSAFAVAGLNLAYLAIK